MQTPDWWKLYGGGHLASPSSIFHAARRERFSSDPPDTMAERFDGSFDPGRLSALDRLRWSAGFSSNGYLRQWAVADWRFAHPLLRLACGLFVKQAYKQAVPIFFLHPLGDQVRAFHSRYLDLLQADEYQALAWLADRSGLVHQGDGLFKVQGLIPDLSTWPVDPTRHTFSTLFGVV